LFRVLLRAYSRRRLS